MSENKHTPEPWEYWENDRTGFGVKMPRKKKTRFGAEPYAVIGGFEQEDRAEMKANARRIVACVNACAGCATEVLETAPVGFFNSTYGHPKYLEEITKQRDELLAALENCRLLAARHRKEEWAGHVLRFCGESGVAGEVMR